MPKKAKGGKKKKGADGPPGDYMMGKSKEKTVEAELNQARSRFVSLQAELIQRSDESSRALAELRIAEKQRDGVRAQSSGMGEDIVSVQRDFARLFRARQQTLIDQIRGLEEQAQELEMRIEETSLRTEDLVKKKDVEIEAVDRKIEDIKKQMKRQAKEFDDMMTTILEKLKEEIRVSTAPKMLLNAGVPIMDDLESVNHEVQSRALE